MKIVNPPSWPRPRGYSNGVIAEGHMLFISGQIGWDENQTLVAPDFLPQVVQSLNNVIAIVNAAGGTASHICRMTWYVTDKQLYLAYQKEIGTAYRELFGEHYPAMTLVEVRDLLEEGALVEIEATAMLT